ncbi:MAG: hypothetical protein ACKV0T_13640 [Planctomycetales bacterium]
MLLINISIFVLALDFLRSNRGSSAYLFRRHLQRSATPGADDHFFPKTGVHEDENVVAAHRRGRHFRMIKAWQAAREPAGGIE